MSAPPGPAPRARPARLLRGLLGGLLATGGLLASIAGGAAAAPAPSPSGPAAGKLPVQVRVTDVSPQVLRPGEDLVVRAQIRNTGSRQLADPRAAVRLNRFLLANRDALNEWERGRATDAAGTAVQSTTLGAPLAPGAQADVEIRVPAAALRLAATPTGWGPRGMSVEVTDGGRRQGLDRTFALWLPTDQVPTTRVSVAVPVTGDGVAPATPAALTGPSASTLRRLDDLVAVTADRPEVAWVVDPALLAATAADGAASDSSTGPEAADQDAGARNRAAAVKRAAAGRDVFSLGWLDPDLGALAHADAADVAATAGALAADSAAGPLGKPARTDLAWPAEPVPDQSTVALAARTGARSIVVGGDGLAPGDLPYTPTGRATVPTPAGDVAALVADPTLTGLLTNPAEQTAATAAQRMLAETAVIAHERPGDPRHLLIAPSRGWRPEVAIARAQLGALTTAPWVSLAPVSTLISTADPDVRRTALPTRSAPDGELSAGSIGALRTARAQLSSFASIATDPKALVAGADADVLAPLGTAWRANPRGRAAVVRAVLTGLTARRSGVQVVPGSRLNLFSQTGTFPVALRNDLAQAVTVRIALVPQNRLLLIDRSQTLVLPARSQLQARIPFHAVGSGDVRVSVALLAPDGTPVSGPSRFTVRVRADWENVGTAALAGVLALAFVIGIVRTIRRGQTARRGATPAQLAQITDPEEASS